MGYTKPYEYTPGHDVEQNAYLGIISQPGSSTSGDSEPGSNSRGDSAIGMVPCTEYNDESKFYDNNFANLCSNNNAFISQKF